MSDESEIEWLVTAVKQSPKYGDTAEATIRVLSADALRRYKKPKQALKAVRTQLHSIMAPYLGDPDYAAAQEGLTAVFAANDPTQIKAACANIMHAHLSTRERLPLLDRFYREIFAITGPPASLLDIACGLNPLAFPWMDLPAGTPFYAYDIHEPRIDFLNHYFRLQGLPPLARLQDVALTFPQEEADVALFLKEMPRFARNYGNLGRPLLEALRVRWLVVSYPAVSTHGGRSLIARYRDFMAQLSDGLPWQTTELLFEGELVFIIEKWSIANC
jgi:16S rRNA (guanine(1405)-N(7))-methyltransferase